MELIPFYDRGESCCDCLDSGACMTAGELFTRCPPVIFERCAAVLTAGATEPVLTAGEFSWVRRVDRAMPPRADTTFLQSLWVIALTALGYYVLGRAAILFAIPPGVATAVWPASGLALAAVILGGYRAGIGIVAGSFLVNIAALWRHPTASDAVIVLVTCIIGCASALQAMAGAHLIVRFAGVSRPLHGGKAVLTFVAVETVCCTIAPYLGVTSLCAGGLTPWRLYSFTWWTWWIGDLIGVLVVAPLILSWTQPPMPRWRPRVALEWVAMVGVLLVLSELVFGIPFQLDIKRLSVPIVLTPLVIWAAYRFGQRGSTAMMVLVSIFGLWGTLQGSGLFVHVSVSESLPLAQTYVGVQATIGLVLSAILDERRRAEADLRQARDLLETRVEERTRELTRALAMLRNTERLAAIGEMMSGLAHETRNALQRSQSCLEMLSREVENRPRAKDLVGRIQSAQDRLHYLYETVNTYAAPIVLNVRESHLGMLLQETWDSVRHLREGKQSTLQSEVGGTELKCWIDPVAIGNVLRSILTNSLQVCDSVAEIRVRWSETSLGGRPALRMALRDNGPGLSQEQKSRIFEPFYTTKTHGTGLGMSIAKRIIEAHGGQIEVALDDGPGAEIQITLPKDRL